MSSRYATILDRWRAHVDAWTTLGLERAAAVAIGYEELNLDFDGTVARLARRLGIPCPHPVRPSVSKNVIVPGPGMVGSFREHLSAEDIAFIERPQSPRCGVLTFCATCRSLPRRRNLRRYSNRFGQLTTGSTK